MDGRCDRCGRFAGPKIVERFDDWQPTPWNGPRIIALCPRCDERRERDGDE